MKAPKKIYLQVCGDCNDDDCENCKFEDFEGNVTWCKDKIFDKDIEYTRTDAFIEKAFEFFGEHLCEYIDAKNANCDTFINIDGDKLKEDFRNYIKGE